ncbi:MAG TPA: hypothetical protein VD837_01235 [Terriglobales bacterium]|nr:hypothetical protein [Terriglobales bacterium]
MLNRTIILALALLIGSPALEAQQTATSQQSVPAFSEWTDDFGGQALDPSKWERFTFEGASGGKVEVREGALRMRGLGGSRFGVRSVPEFSGDRFIVEAKLPGRPVANGIPVANAVLTVLFDSAGRNRLEWIWRSDGRFEAWRVKDGRGEQLDNRNLATNEIAPTIAMARRGDALMFLLNGEVGVEKKFNDLPKNFHVMLYGFGESENDWDSVRVVTVK